MWSRKLHHFFFGLSTAVFAGFQAVMPMIGWICVHTVVQIFSSFEKFIPWIALVLLGYIGGSMLKEGLSRPAACRESKRLGFGALLVQGIATSIDALSVGFTIASYDFSMALLAVGIISLVTFLLCWAGVLVGRKAGPFLAGKAGIFGGIIDGSGVANGISIDSGRETCIHHVSIKNTKIGIGEISKAVGYENKSYFHRLFAKHFGMSLTSADILCIHACVKTDR